LNFQNPSWRTAAILKTVKSPYLLNRLTDLDEIRHSDANQDGGNRHLENLKKIAISSQQFDRSLRNLA